jgi:hypothetical protein
VKRIFELASLVRKIRHEWCGVGRSRPRKLAAKTDANQDFTRAASPEESLTASMQRQIVAACKYAFLSDI